MCFSAHAFICCLDFHDRNSPDIKEECLYKHLANTIKTGEFCFIVSEIVFFHIPAVSTLFTCRFTCRFSPILRVVLREVRGSERAIFIAGSCSTKEGVHAWGTCIKSARSTRKVVYVLETRLPGDDVSHFLFRLELHKWVFAVAVFGPRNNGHRIFLDAVARAQHHR